MRKLIIELEVPDSLKHFGVDELLQQRGKIVCIGDEKDERTLMCGILGKVVIADAN